MKAVDVDSTDKHSISYQIVSVRNPDDFTDKFDISIIEDESKNNGYAVIRANTKLDMESENILYANANFQFHIVARCVGAKLQVLKILVSMSVDI